MSVFPNMDLMKAVVKRILKEEGPMLPSQILDRVCDRLEVIPHQFRGEINNYTRQVIWELLVNDEIIFSPKQILHLPEQKIDQ